jgi:hypothetical protein
MGIRQDQMMGLSSSALSFISELSQKDEIVDIRFVNGKLVDISTATVAKIVENDKSENYKFFGMFEQEYKLNAYLLKDGKKIYEKLQASPWSSGPMFFLALVDENDEWIEATKWDEKVIEKEASCGPIEEGE